MKTLTIYTRTILEKTGFSNKKYAFKQKMQFIVFYDNQECKNHYESMNNPRLKIKFNQVLKTRSLNKVNEFTSKLSKSNDDQSLKEAIENVLKIGGVR